MRALGVAAGGVVLVAFAACSLPGSEYTSAADAGDTTTRTGDASSGVKDAAADGPLPGTVDAAPAAGCPSAGHSCVADAPDGWNGPLFVYDGDESQVPDCPAAMNVARVDAHRGFRGENGTDTCSACSCRPANGATCTPQVNSGATDCSSLPNTSTPDAMSCTLIGPNVGYTITFTSTGGACPPSGGVPQLAPINWDSKVRACGADGLLRTGCADGQICSPDPPYPFKGKLCVMKKGDVDCPAAPSPYGTKTLSNGLDDSRDCTKCACDPPTNIQCQGQAVLYKGGGNCLGGIPSFVTAPTTSCQSNGNANSGLRVANSFSTGGSCTPTGDATPTGTVAAGDPVTICCAN